MVVNSIVQGGEVGNPRRQLDSALSHSGRNTGTFDTFVTLESSMLHDSWPTSPRYIYGLAMRELGDADESLSRRTLHRPNRRVLLCRSLGKATMTATER